MKRFTPEGAIDHRRETGTDWYVSAKESDERIAALEAEVERLRSQREAALALLREVYEETRLDTPSKERCYVCDSGAAKNDPDGWEHRPRCPVPRVLALLGEEREEGGSA